MMEEKINDKQLEISLVIPALNEGGNIEPLYRKIIKALEVLNRSYEIIFIDDGSTDSTYAEMKKIANVDKNVKIIKFQRNFKKAAAYSAGIQRASGKIVVTMDADLQDDPEDMGLLLDKIDEGYDYVSGWKHERKANLGRSWASRVFNFVTRSITHIQLHDFNCPFKAFRSGVVDPGEIYGELHRYIPVLVSKKGYKITEVKVRNYERIIGVSKYGAERFLRGFFDLLTIVLLTRYFSSPLYLFGSLGIVLGFIGASIIGTLYAMKFFWGIYIRNTPFLFILGAMGCILGVQLVTFGLLAELMVSFQIKNTKQFTIEKENNFS